MGRVEPGLPIPDHTNAVDLHAEHRFEQTGGDLFDTVRVGQWVAFLLSDIAGKRPELDPISEEMRKVFRARSTALLSAADVNLMETAETLVHDINQALIETAKGVRFAPTLVGCYDVQLGILAYINAGGQTALFHDAAGTRALPNMSVPLGLFTHLTYDASIQAFGPGTMLLVVTKGVTESMENSGPSGQDRLTRLLDDPKYRSASQLCHAVLESAVQSEKHRWDWLPFRGPSHRQDMTALVMVRTE